MPAHLKEEDDLIAHIQRLVVGADRALRVREGFSEAQALMQEHHRACPPLVLLGKHNVAEGIPPAGSSLEKVCPTVSPIFLELDLLTALDEFDCSHGLTQRRFVPPSFAEIRKVLNLSVVNAAARPLKLLTLDADETIYADGLTLSAESPIIPLLIKAMRLGIHVSLVTAAGYPGEPHKFEARIAGLLRGFAFAIEAGAKPDLLRYFHVMGGESNYLLEPAVEMDSDGLAPRVFLREIRDSAWKDGRGVRWNRLMVQELLDAAETCLKETAERLGLDVLVIRKERAVGIIPNPKGRETMQGAYTGRLTYETLEEVALTVQAHLTAHSKVAIPFCAFNGGHDVFIDVGSKALGIRALQARVGATPAETVHAGDRFTRTGNDLKAREFANTLWVDGPPETEFLLTRLLENVRAERGAAHGTQVLEPPGAIDRSQLAAIGLGRTPSDITTPVESPPPDHELSPASSWTIGGLRPCAGIVSPPALLGEVPRLIEGGSGAPTSGSGMLAAPAEPDAFSHRMHTASGHVAEVVRTPALSGMPEAYPHDLSSFEALELDKGGHAAAVRAGGQAADGLAHVPRVGAGRIFALSRAASTSPQLASPMAASASAGHIGLHRAASAGSLVGKAGTPRLGGISAGSPHLMPGVYGITAERAHLQAASFARDAQRSQWESAGGFVAAEVRPTPRTGPRRNHLHPVRAAPRAAHPERQLAVSHQAHADTHSHATFFAAIPTAEALPVRHVDEPNDATGIDHPDPAATAGADARHRGQHSSGHGVAAGAPPVHTPPS